MAPRRQSRMQQEWCSPALHRWVQTGELPTPGSDDDDFGETFLLTPRVPNTAAETRGWEAHLKVLWLRAGGSATIPWETLLKRQSAKLHPSVRPKLARKS